MFAYYVQVKSSESTTVLPKTFDILTYENYNINVNIWFQGNIRALERCLLQYVFKNYWISTVKEVKNNLIKF